jgi:ATP-dependent Clp protease ATP-binding subunit ClpC
MNDIVSKFTNHLKNALTRALCLVVESKGDAISPAHLLWALATQQGSVAAEILMKAGITKEQLKDIGGDAANKMNPISHEQNLLPTLSDDAKILIEKAVLTANAYEHKYIGTEHLLSSMMQIQPNEVKDFFDLHKINNIIIENNLATVLKTTTNFPEIAEKNKAMMEALQELESLGLDEENTANAVEDDTKSLAIDYFTDELTNKEWLENVTPVIGRDKEIQRLSKILARRQKNNPILVGEPGVGKTAIVEGLAKHIVEGSVPETLSEKRILRLDLASLIAGTMYRGEFESRLRQLIDEVVERPEIILFIDEVHAIMGAGSASGSLDAANILKPALARGDIRCIGATTPAEYKKFIETDGALERRFQQISVREPDQKKTKKILQGVKAYYENHHDVEFSDLAIDSAIYFAHRYFTEKHFPDKAIDILDEAGAEVNIKRKKRSVKINIPELQNQLEKLTEKKKQAVLSETFEDAIRLKEEESAIKEKLELAKQKPVKRKRIKIEPDDIMRVVADMIEIPIQQLSKNEQQKLSKLETTIQKIIIGQDKSVKRVTDAVRRAKLGIAKSEKPLASFLFVGPSGVGKTHLAKTLAKEIFHQSDAFLRLDMSEFGESFTISKLVGSPAGYVGYRESTKLTDHVKQFPHSVILFDEFEKAHKDVRSLLLQILDDGMLTDATGRKINFRNTIIIMTTNAGRAWFDKTNLGFSDNENNTEQNREAQLREMLSESFKPELLNRIGHICIFNRLNRDALEKIAKNELSDLRKRLNEKNVELSVATSAVKALAKQVNLKLGARDLQRIIEERIEHRIAEIMIEQTGPLKLNLSSTKTGEIALSKKRS